LYTRLGRSRVQFLLCRPVRWDGRTCPRASSSSSRSCSSLAPLSLLPSSPRPPPHADCADVFMICALLRRRPMCMGVPVPSAQCPVPVLCRRCMRRQWLARRNGLQPSCRGQRLPTWSPTLSSRTHARTHAHSNLVQRRPPAPVSSSMAAVVAPPNLAWPPRSRNALTRSL
jgi:hypothetical protein